MILSIVTINLNNLQGLTSTLSSLAKLLSDIDASWFEWIIVDSKSTDGSINLIKELSTSDHRIIHVSEHDRGIYDAMRLGLQSSRGDYILFLNSGDRILGDFSILKHISHPFFFSSISDSGRLRPLINSPLVGLPTSHQSIVFPRNSIQVSLDYTICGDYYMYLHSVVQGVSYQYSTGLISVTESGGISSKNLLVLYESFLVKYAFYGLFRSLLGIVCELALRLSSLPSRTASHSLYPN